MFDGTPLIMIESTEALVDLVGKLKNCKVVGDRETAGVGGRCRGKCRSAGTSGANRDSAHSFMCTNAHIHQRKSGPND